MNKKELRPIDLACFEQVAKVIRFDAAVIELQRVIDSGIEIGLGDTLYNAFQWEDTPQGDGFWCDIDCGKLPDEYKSPAVAPSRQGEAPKFNDLSKDKQNHFLRVIKQVGEPPKDATHVDWTDGDYFFETSWLRFEEGSELFYSSDGWCEAVDFDAESRRYYAIPEKPWYDPADVAFKDKKEEYTGGSVNYYKVQIDNPTTINEPYEAECNDIIEALQMNYAEGNAFKAIWRKCAARLGSAKKGYTDGLYDSEKVVFFGNRMVEQCKSNKLI